AVGPLWMVALGVRSKRVELGLAHPRRAEELGEFRVVGMLGRMIEAEVVHVETEAAVFAYAYSLIHVVQITRLAVRRHPHDLVLTFVDFKAEEGGKGRI